MNRLLIAALGCLIASSAAAAEESLAKIPFWRASEGWWQSENTYFDGQLNYNIRSYNSLVHVELEGGTVRETEYKFYSPSKLALQNGRGQTKEGEGVEVVTVTVAKTIDGKGTVKIVDTRPAVGAAAGTTIAVLDDDTAVRVTDDPASDIDSYRMFITLPAPHKRYKANFGIASVATKDVPAGDLRGFSLFRETRVDAADVERLRAELRTRNNVRAVVTAGPDNAPRVQRLEHDGVRPNKPDR